jgi:uncharacterized damage-inducible protein DinB
MEWADARMWRAIARHTGAADEKLGTLVVHLHNVQQGFLNTWTSQPMAFREATDFESLDGIREWARPYYAGAFRFLETVEEARLDEPIEMPWVAGANFEKPTLNETMFQVTSHSTYHRGQVNMRLRQIGLESVNVDYIMWLWKGRPEAKWG